MQQKERSRDTIVQDQPAVNKRFLALFWAKWTWSPPTHPKILLLRRRRVLRGKCSSTFIHIPYFLVFHEMLQNITHQRRRQSDLLNFGRNGAS